MFFDGLLCALVFAIAIIPAVHLLPRDRRVGALLCAGAALFVTTAIFGAKHRQTANKHSTDIRQSVPRPERSGYVRSDRCQSCHPREYATWHDSFHRTMTQIANPETVLGTFDRTELSLNGENYLLTREGDDYWVEMTDLHWK